MMHGPCGVAIPNSQYMGDGKCTKKFPKDFTEVTMECDGYPQYRRRNYGKYVTTEWSAPQQQIHSAIQSIPVQKDTMHI